MPNDWTAPELALGSAPQCTRPQVRDENRANFDRLARAYRWLEYFSFGPFLGRCRLQFLPEMAEARRVLLLGDGDGRFLERLLAVNARCSVDAVDSSPAMLTELKRRVDAMGRFGSVRLHRADAREFEPLLPDYDLVVTHFFLDCFSTEDLRTLAARVVPHLRPNALWVVSEFAVPKGRTASVAARLFIGGLYRIFGLLTGLTIRRLPDHSAAMREAGLVVRQRKSHLGGLLISEIFAATVESL